MSLINDMLRDLEDRGKSTVSDTIKIQSPSGSSNTSAYLSATVAFLLVVVLVLLDKGSDTSEPELDVVDEAPIFVEASKIEASEDGTPKTAQKPASENADPVLMPNYYARAMTAVEQGKVTPSVAKPLTPQDIERIAVQPVSAGLEAQDPLAKSRAAQIEKLMRLGNLALLKDRLTSPDSDNAFDRYSQVLKLSPDHLEAQAGLDSIAERYVDLADKYWHRGRETRARVLLKRAQLVSPTLASAEALSDKMTKEGRQDDFQRQQTVTATVGQLKSQKEQSSTQTSNQISNRESAKEVKALAQGSGVDETSQVEKIQNPEFLDRESARRAQSLFKAGKNTLAQQQLMSFLDTQKQAPESFVELFNFYLAKADYLKAQSIVNRYPEGQVNSSLYTARIFAAQKRYSEAIDTLAPTINAASDFSHRALLASLYNRSGRFSNAAKSYKQLLIDDGERPNYWLGLAVALDGMDDRARALVAFEQAATGRHNSEVQAYIEARIDALSDS